MLYGTGKYTYELVDGWAKCPEGFSFFDVCGLSIDSQDRVYILSRSAHPVMVFDREGNLLTSWGEGFFKRAHGTCVGPDGAVYCTDDKDHTVRKFTPEGNLLQVLGSKDQPSDTGYVQQPRLAESLATIRRGGPPFNRPTGVALSSSGEIYVSDGYGNARVHKFTPDGTLLFSWGEPGDAPSQFRLPHSIWVDKQERVWVVDRENNRIQIFNAQGEFLTQWTDLSRPTDIFIDDEETVYVSELSPRRGVSIFTIDGKLLARWSSQQEEDKETALFLAPHAIAVDSRGDLYVGEVSVTYARIDRGPRTVQKFARRT
jgi:DNA-binding beta-propeller fold protein YncE